MRQWSWSLLEVVSLALAVGGCGRPIGAAGGTGMGGQVGSTGAGGAGLVPTGGGGGQVIAGSGGSRAGGSGGSPSSRGTPSPQCVSDAPLTAQMAGAPPSADRLAPAPPPPPTWGDPSTLPPDVLADRLTQLFWNVSAPPEFVERVRRCGPRTPADLAALAAQLWPDRRTDLLLRAFLTRWLDLPTLRDRHSKGLALIADLDAVIEEPLAFGVDVIRQEVSHLRTLLTADHSILSPSVAKIYGLAHSGAAMERRPLPPERRGLLSQAWFSALGSVRDRTSPSLRGLYVFDTLLCTPLPAPPLDVKMILPPASQALPTMRHRLNAVTEQPVCAGCHRLFDPVGLAFEVFDFQGQHRTTDNGARIDQAGQLSGIAGGDGGFFNDHIQLAELLLQEPSLRECVVLNAFRLAAGRPELTVADIQSEIASLAYRLERTDSIRELFLDVVATRFFLTGQPVPTP